MAAGRAEGITGRDDARTDDLAGVDRLLQADIVPVVGTEIADGGEAGHQRVVRMRHRHRGPEAVAELQIRVAAVGRVAVDVHVHVDQARQQGHVLEIDALGARGHGIARASHRDDAAFADDDLRVVDDFSAAYVEHARGGDDPDIAPRSRGFVGMRREGCGGQNEAAEQRQETRTAHDQALCGSGGF